MNKFGLRLDISLEEMEMSMGHTFRQDGVSVNRSACVSMTLQFTICLVPDFCFIVYISVFLGEILK